MLLLLSEVYMDRVIMLLLLPLLMTRIIIIAFIIMTPFFINIHIMLITR